MHIHRPLANLRSPLAGGALALALAGSAPAQDFVQVTDPTNEIVIASVSGAYTGAAWVDVDDDGLLDMYICRKNAIYRNLGGGQFDRATGAITQQGQPLGTTWSDYDNDGDIDCFLSAGPFLTNASLLYRNDGNFSFTKVVAPEGGDAANTLDNAGWGCSFGDVDNDGYTDIVVAAANGFGGVFHENILLMNDGDGTFTDDNSTPITELLDAHTIPTFSDYDLDGDLDLFIGSGEVSQLSPDNLFRNLLTETGSFGFERITDAPIATDLLDGQVWNLIDYDNDGDLDAFQTNYNFNLSNKLYRNDGGTYVTMTTGDVGDIVGTSGAGLANLWADFDNDGDLDCFVTNDGAATSEYWINDGDGTFTRDVTTPVATGAGPHYGAAAADYDNDGDVDLYVHGNNNTRGLYRNDLANGNHWLNIKLRGAGAPLSNRSAIGAKVRAVATIGGQPTAQLREVLAQNSFNSMNMLNVHIGLGDATVVDSLFITWPAGGTTVLTAVAADQFLELTEGGTTDVTPLPTALDALTLHAWPNPFTRETAVEFALPVDGDVRLRVFDVAGRAVRTLTEGQRVSGAHRVTWDARDAAGRRLGPGVYFYRMEAAGAVAVRKVVLLD